MKYRLLRFSLLSMLVMLFGGLSIAAILEGSSEKTGTIDLSDFANLTVTKAGTSTTGGDMEVSKGDIVVTSALGYAKSGEMSIYKNGSMTIGFKQGVIAHITKAEITLSNSYPFVEPADWSTSYTLDGESVTASTTAKVTNQTIQTFTTTASDISSLKLTNASNGKTGIRKIVVYYVVDSSTGGGDDPGEEEGIANPYTYTFESKVFDSKTQTKELAGANWTLNMTCGDETSFFGYDGTKGQQFGSSSMPATALTLSTSDIPGTITSIKINTSGAKDIAATFGIKVGDSDFKYDGATTATLTKDATPYEFKGSASGDVVISYTQTSSKAIYIKSIEIAYTEEAEEGWRDIKIDLTNKNLLTEGEIAGITDETNKTPSMNIGVAVASDGTISRVANDAAEAAAVLTGKWHSNEHGWSNFSATVPVEGPVKITFGTCAWGGNVTVKDATGAEVVKAFSTNTGACYHNNKDANIVSAYYKGDAATLTIAGGSYVPYFAVEAVDPADIPSKATVTFDASNSNAEGVAPAAAEVEIGSKYTIPANRTLYKEGSTLTAWTDGTNQYKAGDEVTVNEDMTLTPVFTVNESFTITEPTTVIWDFQQKNGAPLLNYGSDKTGIYVAQAEIGGKSYDQKLDFNTGANGKIANGSWADWCQMNSGTTFTITAQKGMTVSLESYSATTTTTIAGSTDYTTEDKVASYTYEGSGSTIDIVIGDGSYFRYIKVVYPVPEQEEAGFADIKVDLTEKNLLTESEIAGIQDESNKNPSMNIGIVVDAEGNISRVANDADNANAVLTGKWHSNDHGWSNFSATVPVEGTVKITFGTCAWGGDVTVKNADGATVATFNTNTGACYHNDKDANIISAYYKQDVATTLTISGGSYVPYFAVEKVDPKDVPSDVKFVFDASESGAVGIAPEDATVGIGKSFTMPKNFTLYKEGYTLTAWTDGTNSYAVGEDMTAPDAESITLTPVFTQNEVSLADRTEAVTVKWNFRRDAGAPTVAYQNATGIWVAQATVNGKTIDVKADFDTNNDGKFANGSWTDWAQLNNGTKWTIPSCKGATISIEAFSELGAEGKIATTIDGQSDYTSAKTISYEIGGSAETVDVVIGNDGSYYRYIQAVLPVVQSAGGETFDNVDAIIEWPMLVDGNVDLNAYTATPATAVSLASFDYTPSTAAVSTGSRSKDPDNGLQFVTFTGENVVGHWFVKPVKGLTFTPTQIKLYVQRFGTNKKDGVVVTAKVGDEGAIQTLGTYTARRANWDDAQEEGQWGEKLSNLVNEVVIDLTEAQQTALASGEGFHLYATTGLSNKAAGFNDCRIYGKVDGTAASVEMFTLAAVASPEEAGSVSKYPNADEYEAGTEVTMTATENFGYDFVNWTNAAGEEVSTDAKFKYTVKSNETLTANFVAVETYELALAVDGTNDYMVTVSPAPEVVDGKWMYEAGTAVQLTANQYEGLVTFTNWNDGETNSSKLISMDADTELTAYYAQADIIAGWDFYKAGNNGRKADFYAQDNDADALNLVNTETGETSGWLDKSTVADGGYESFKGAAVNWRDNVGTHHWQTKVNAGAFTDINVQFQMLYNYNSYQKYNAEYSFDGETWVNFGSITMEGAKNAASFNEQLPAECNNKADLYIRMIADKNSEIVGSAGKDGNALAMFFITGTPKIVDDGKAPVLVSTVPADGATGVSASGKIVLTFNERVKVVEGTVAYINNPEIKSNTQNPTTPTVSGKVVTFEYKGLEYGTQYNFVLAGKTVGDLTDNMIQDDITIKFTTMDRPTVEKKLYDAVVENVDQLVAALAEAQNRADKNVRYRIFLKKGTYTLPQGTADKTFDVELGTGGTTTFTKKDPITYFNAQNVSMIGEDRDATIITNTIPADDTFEGKYGTASIYEGIGKSDVFQLSGSNSYWQDLTVSTGMADARGRDIAVEDKGTRTIWKNTKLHGYQDTWVGQNDNGLYYFEDGVIRGRTDYICGKGDAYYNQVEFQQIAGGYCAVPSKPANIGWVMKDCTINGDGSGVDGNYTLGRPWGQGTPVALWIDTKMNVVPSAIGWNEMSGGWPARFAEYNSTTSTGSVIDLSGRKKTFGDGHANNPELTAEEALNYSDKSKMFGDWDPTLATEQAPIVQDVKLTDNTLTWTGSNYALLYAIVKNGEVIDFTTENTYTISSADAAGSRRAGEKDEYQIRAANEMGGLNEASEVATETDGIETVNVNDNLNVDDNVYNLQGIRVSKAQKGVYIINGRKVVVK